jgi:hypothetical protein
MPIKVTGILALDGKQWEAGLRKAETGAGRLASSLNSSIKSRLAAAFSVGVIAKLSKDTVDYAGRVNDLSQRLGVSTETLQEFDFAAKQSGTSLEKFTEFMERVGSEREKALSGNEEVIESFARLGVTIEDLKGKRVDELTKQIASKVKDADIQKIIAPLRAIGGRGAGELVAAFKSGLEEAGAAAREQNAIISDAVIQQLDEVGDRFTIFGMQLKAGLAPAIAAVSDVIQAFVDMASKAGAFLGAITANLDFGKIIKSQFSLEGLTKGGAIGELSRQLGSGSLEADKAVKKVEEEIIKREEQIIKNRQTRKETPPPFGESEERTKEERVKAAPKPKREIASDALVRVGNFLGASGQNNIAAIQQQQTKHLSSIDKTLQAIFRQRPQSFGFNLDANTP